MARYHDDYDWDAYYDLCDAREAAREESAREIRSEILSDFGLQNIEYAGYTVCWYEGEIDSIYKVVRRAVRTARRDHKDGKVKAGDRYEAVTTRYIDPETRKSRHYHTKRIIKAA